MYVSGVPETRPNVYRFGSIDILDIFNRNDVFFRHENHDRPDTIDFIHINNRHNKYNKS